MGKVVKAVTKPVAKIANPILGKGSDLLFGKEVGEDPLAGAARRGSSDQLTTGRQGLTLTRRGIAEFNKALDTDAEKLAKTGLQRQVNTLQGSAQDQRRRLQEVIARRGLGGSSIGLAQQRGIQQQLGERVAEARASLPERIQQLRLQRAQSAISSGLQPSGGIPAVPIQFGGGRQGGIAGLVGGAIGGIYGGPQGAAAGYQIGEGVKQSKQAGAF